MFFIKQILIRIWQMLLCTLNNVKSTIPFIYCAVRQVNNRAKYNYT